VEPEVNPWDLAPLKVIVEEAGGRFTDLRGDARIDGGSAVSSNGLLHDAILAALR
jgi:histidinol-phosphatase